MKTPSRHLLVLVTLLLAAHAGGEEQPRKLETLTTSKGRTYEKVQIREITPAGIKIAHDSGTATISFQELPAALQQQLGGFDHKAAEAHRKEEDAKVRSQEAEIERGLREQQKAANPVKPAPAPAPAPGSSPAPAPAAPAGGAENPWEMPLQPEITPEETSLPDPAPEEEEPVQPKLPSKGVLSTRILGYRSGVKRVEFRARANCKGKLEVHRVIPDHHSIYGHTHTYDIEPNKEFAEEIWVYNNYSADLSTAEGKILDSEAHDKKTSLGGGLGGTSLR